MEYKLQDKRLFRKYTLNTYEIFQCVKMYVHIPTKYLII